MKLEKITHVISADAVLGELLLLPPMKTSYTSRQETWSNIRCPKKSSLQFHIGLGEVNMDKKFSKFQCYKLDRIADCEILKDDYFDKTHLDYMKVKCECGEEHYFVKIRGEDHG